MKSGGQPKSVARFDRYFGEAGLSTAEVCREHGISTATFCGWKAKFGGMEVCEAKRLMQLEDENAKLKRLLADAMPDNAALKDLMTKKF
jgi:putative transposase